MKSSADVGVHGEQVACRYLLAKGYQYRGKNVRVGRDEIDRMMFDPFDDVLVFVEVKSRSVESDSFHPSLNITPAKKKKLLRGARLWIAQNEYQGSYRIDVIYVQKQQVVQHIKQLECDDYD